MIDQIKDSSQKEIRLKQLRKMISHGESSTIHLKSPQQEIKIQFTTSNFEENNL